MSITINSSLDNINDCWKVCVEGELDVSTADELKKSLHKLVDERNIDVRMNFESLDYIDSTGLGVMIGILKRLKIENKEVYIEKPKSNVRKILNITGLDKIFKLEG